MSPSAPRVRISAGPSLSSLQPLTPNSSPVRISSPTWDGFISVRLRGYPGEHGLELEEGTTWSICFEGRWKEEVEAEEVMFGNVWEKPIKSYGTSAALRFMRYVDPSLECDLYADKPWALSPLFATLQYMSARELSPTEPLPPFKPDSFPEDLSPLVAASDMPALKDNPASRRSYFSKPAHLAQTRLSPHHLVRGDFSHGFINFDTLSLSLPGGLSFSLAKYWNALCWRERGPGGRGEHVPEKEVEAEGKNEDVD
ncbi:duf1769 family protein [Rhodotorula toruloides]|uniref:Duf1769 family protein n=1 Tax=Rhodotorula toruloides TaxID=5286 RepID=A0A511KB88_RHOTO|nr:duf1769 family protein [Rhodotorula toruloides]